MTLFDFPIRFSNCSDGSYIFSFSIISAIICSAICLQSNVILAILRSIYGGGGLTDLYIYFGFWCVHHDLLIATIFISLLHKQRVRSGVIHSIQHYVMKFVSDLRQVGDFLWYSGFLHQ